MADGDYLTLSEAADLVGVKYNSIAKRVRRFRQDNPGTILVRTDPAGADGGRDRVMIASSLIDQWRRVPTRPGPTLGATRDEIDHLRAEHEVSAQSARHLEIQLQHLELTRRDDRIAELEAEVQSLKSDKAELHEMLVKALGKYVTD